MLLVWDRIGQETLTDDGFADEDIENELGPISVQLAYVQQVFFMLLALSLTLCQDIFHSLVT